MMQMKPTTSAVYDETPYPSYAYPRTAPGRLAALGTLFGISPPAPATARVLELGCGMGGNLLPIAARFPRGRFLGIDYSAVQIAQAQVDAAALGLANVRFDGRSILDIPDDELGTFDYVIAHGLYSWVPAPVRERLMEMIGRILAPNGVAYVSFNARPGWDAIRSLRDAMLYRIRDLGSNAERIEAARRFADYMAGHMTADAGAVREVLAREVERMKRIPDAFLLHDHLEATNDAFYLSEVLDHAAAHGLRYLGDATLYAMPLATPSDDDRERIARIGACGDLAKIEQYRDFLNNRRFRMTLLCRSSATPNWRITPDSLAKLRIVSDCRPPRPVPPHAKGRLKALPLDHRGKPVGTVAGVTLVACVLAAIEAGPAGLPFGELVATAARALARPRGEVARDFAEAFGNLASAKIVDVALLPPSYALKPAARPHGFAPARLAVGRGEIAPNMRHETVRLDAAQRAVLAQLDGRHGLAELAAALPEVENPAAVLQALADMALLRK